MQACHLLQISEWDLVTVGGRLSQIQTIHRMYHKVYRFELILTVC